MKPTRVHGHANSTPSPNTHAHSSCVCVLWARMAGCASSASGALWVSTAGRASGVCCVHGGPGCVLALHPLVALPSPTHTQHFFTYPCPSNTHWHLLLFHLCSRSLLVGALLAAQDGLDGVPAVWRERTAMYRELEGLVDKVIASRA
eukprot:232475-Chlamydomonas_euryale.AAC.2